MKKLVSLLLAAMMVAVLVPTLAESPEGYPEVVEGIDFGGATLYINPYWGPTPRKENPSEDEALTYAYQDWIMETYNVKIVEEQVGNWGDAQVQEIQNFISSADGTEYRIFLMPPGFIGSPMANGWFAPWNGNELVDLSGEEWNPAIIDFMTMGGNVYGVSNQNTSEPRQCIFFNKRVLEDAGVDWNTIYDMQLDKTWTWEAFENLCAQLTVDKDSDGVNDVYGLTGNTADLWLASVFSNNGSFFDFDEEGKLAITAGSDNTLEALTWAANLWNNYAMPQPEGSNWDFFKDAFKAGNCAFYIYQTYGGYNDGAELADMADDWGCVAFPIGPRGDDYVYVISDNVVVLPNVYDAETTKKLQFIYDLWISPVPGIDREEGWIGNKYEICSDERAVDETYAMLRDTAAHGRADRSVYLGDNNLVLGSNTYGNFFWGMLWDTPAALLEAITPAWQSLCDTFNGK